MYAAIQSRSIKGAVTDNVARHVHLVQQAARYGARFALFPELSLTGYELELAGECALTPGDRRLSPLREQARVLGMSIVAGAPLRDSGGALRIAAIGFHPDSSMSVYCKQHLHPGEETIFAPGHDAGLLDLEGTRIALAVCADIARPAHASTAALGGAQLYAASVLVSPNGYETDSGFLKDYARRHRMVVLMANHAGTTGGWTSYGGSAFWNEDGKYVAAAPDNAECLVLAWREGGNWHGRVCTA